jgi:hypothetical protein
MCNSNQAMSTKISHKLWTTNLVAFDENDRQVAHPVALCLRFLEKDVIDDKKRHDYTDVDD